MLPDTGGATGGVAIGANGRVGKWTGDGMDDWPDDPIVGSGVGAFEGTNVGATDGCCDGAYSP